MFRDHSTFHVPKYVTGVRLNTTSSARETRANATLESEVNQSAMSSGTSRRSAIIGAKAGASVALSWRCHMGLSPQALSQIRAMKSTSYTLSQTSR